MYQYRRVQPTPSAKLAPTTTFTVGEFIQQVLDIERVSITFPAFTDRNMMLSGIRYTDSYSKAIPGKKTASHLRGRIVRALDSVHIADGRPIHGQLNFTILAGNGTPAPANIQMDSLRNTYASLVVDSHRESSVGEMVLLARKTFEGCGVSMEQYSVVSNTHHRYALVHDHVELFSCEVPVTSTSLSGLALLNIASAALMATRNESVMRIIDTARYALTKQSSLR